MCAHIHPISGHSCCLYVHVSRAAHLRSDYLSELVWRGIRFPLSPQPSTARGSPSRVGQFCMCGPRTSSSSIHWELSRKKSSLATPLLPVFFIPRWIDLAVCAFFKHKACLWLRDSNCATPGEYSWEQEVYWFMERMPNSFSLRPG